MTIKQTGGIFGRSPTFADVEITGQLQADSGQFDGNVNIDGTVTADGLTVDGSGSVSAKIESTGANYSELNIKNTSANYTLGIRPDVSHAFIIRDASNTANRISLATNGDISFYEDTGTTPKFFWDASAERLGIGTSSPADPLHVYTSDAGVARLESTSANSYLRFITSADTNGYVGYEGNDIVIYANNSKVATFDSSGNVGIGNTTPSSYNDGSDNLVIGNGGSNGISIHAGVGMLHFTNVADTTERVSIKSTVASSTLEFTTAGTERMRIDSSGNLLVGTTTTYPAGSGVSGAFIESLGRIEASRASAPAIRANRNTTDGDIMEFKKDGATVGSIASRAGLVSTLILDPRTPSSNTGAGLGTTSAKIVPADTSGLTDAKSDLGADGNRFKDLYLSGGVYLGGTGAANLLDDYETGTWTPVIEGSTTAGTGTYTIQEGNYVKIGRLVYFQFYAQWTAHTGTGNLNHSLPFSVNNTGSNFPPCSAHTDNIALSAIHYSSSSVLNELGYGQLKQYPVGGGAQANVPMDTAGGLLVSGTYYTT